ncbi:sensor histidine kinase [Pseudarcicella hirudinis]|nr:histidine kinase [Pseudarcicella hirudinis]
MEATRHIFPNNKAMRIALVLFAFAMLYLISYLLNPYSAMWVGYFEHPPLMLIGEWVVTLFFCVIISETSILINTKLNKRLPWTKKPINRLFTETTLNIASVLFIILIQNYIFILMNAYPEDGMSSMEAEIVNWHWSVVSIIVALMLSTIHTGNHLIHNWKNSAMEAAEHKLKAAEHKQAAVEAELQALKLQIDPHFVFNNLSVLSELILEDQQLGYNYAENFSKVYRYLLVNSKKNMITLEEEIKFLNAYIFLLKHRAGSGVVFKIDIQEGFYNLYLPPLTLQLLIENALKHNKTLKDNPLKITIESNNNLELVVSNSFIPLERKVLSSGTGLNNIIHRYKLLCDRVPKITSNPLLFSVSIPLIRL